MAGDDTLDAAIETLMELGLQEYEARCFVGLSRVPSATAKRLGEVTDVPRTRVYDAVRSLEARGLVEIRHESPQRYRAVPLAEAVETLRKQYEARIERLADALDDVEAVDPDGESAVQEVWAMAGTEAIEERVNSLVDDAEEEVVLVLCEDALLTDDLVETLRAVDGDVDLIVGTTAEDLRRRVADAVPRATTFVSGLEWLRGDADDDRAVVGRFLLVDRNSLLASSIPSESGEERATFGSGFGNGLVVVARRLMARGILPRRDPGGVN